jgi:hypothetical protein
VKTSADWPRFIIRLHGLNIERLQWRVLELLEPGWLIVDKGAFHYHTRRAMVRKGWIEVRVYETHMLARLTPAGREIRDRVDVMMARRRYRDLVVARRERRKADR